MNPLEHAERAERSELAELTRADSGSLNPDLPPEIAIESARTWDAPGEEQLDPLAGELPQLLREPATGGPVARGRALRRRHLAREGRANDFVAAAMTSSSGLPVATPTQVLGFLGGLLRSKQLLITVVVLANIIAASAGLLVPRLLGGLVDSATTDIAAGAAARAIAAAGSTALLVAGIVLAQAVFTLVAKAAATQLGQGLLADAREVIIRDILRLPLSRVESASSGDLVTRVTRDAGTMSESVTWGLPESIFAGITVVLTLVAMLSNSWLLSLPSLVLIGVSLIQIRRYLRRAPRGYLTEAGSYSRINTTLTETVEGARTIEALRITGRRLDRGARDIAQSAQAERYTLTLRNLLFAVMDISFSLPRVLVLALGAYGYWRGWVTIGQITTAVLYVEAIWGPFDMLVHTVDRVQVGVASTTRLLGISTVQPDRQAGPDRPTDSTLRARGLRYAYRADHDVLHGVDLDLRSGERLAIVGPSGSGKSTLGRLIAGIHPPRTGTMTVGGVEVTRLPLEELRSQVALVTQEHHVFIGTVRENVVLARRNATDGQVMEALASVDALDWVDRLPDRLDTRLGSGNHALTPGRAQQIALARLVLADPHTIVLDEATSLIDPRTARHLEGSMNALLDGRTVVAIAHRLHTAHDADRIAVVIDGRIAELGTHDELIDRDGDYAALWRAWTS